MASSFRLVLLFAGLSLAVQTAFSQTVSRRVLEENRTGVRLEFVANWPRGMQAALDSVGLKVLTDEAIAAISGGLLETGESFHMPSLGLPTATIVESESDEIRIEQGAVSAELLDVLTQPVLVAGWPGVERRKPVASASVQLLTYDPESSTLRRFRRLVVQVVFPLASPGSSRSMLRVTSDDPHLAVSRSALADGHLFKFPVQTEGVYRIGGAALNQLLSQAGLTAGSLDPATIKILGNGGAPLPAKNSDPRPADVIENPVLVRPDGSGSYEIIFYARGPTGWTYIEGSEEWRHYTHPFSNENYYFLKIDPAAADGRRVPESSFPGIAGAAVVDQVIGRHMKEYDEVMWSKGGGTGHTWVSAQIRSYQQLDVFQALALSGLEAGDVRYRAHVAIRSNQSNPRTAVSFISGGSVLGTLTTPPVSLLPVDSPMATSGEVTFSQQVSARAPLNLQMRIQERPDDPQAALDWIRVFYPQKLEASGGMLRFATPPGLSGVIEFVLTGFSQTPRVWDVTDVGSIRALGVSTAGGSYRVQIELSGEAAPREIVAFTDAAAVPVEPAVRVANQNLHGISGYPEFVIITPDTFRVYAEELAEHRRAEGMTVFVADVDQIYNEFSGGVPDMRAVRDFFRFIYNRAPNEDQMIRYGLLFGDGHFNYRELGSPKPELNNWVFPFETEASFHPISSYTSDDYFGLLDDHEGAWTYDSQPVNTGEIVDIGIGRFTVQTPAEARTVVEKIKQYESTDTFGSWRLRYTFVADDGYTGLDARLENPPDLHTQNADLVAEQAHFDYPTINLQKIYGISYPRVFLNNWRQPEVRRDILASIADGALLVNYSGHGGEDGLAQERIFTREDAIALDNGNRLPIFITATCSFGRWDMAGEQSGAEELLINPRGGAVALLTTVRLVYTSSSTASNNLGLNLELNNQLFKRDPDGLPRRLGDVLRETKRTRRGLETNSRKFNLLGDPTLRLGIPSATASIDAVNGSSVSAGVVPVRALEHTTIEGRVLRANGEVDEQFDGPIQLTVFDAERRVPVPEASALPRPYYTVREDLIWRGEVKAAAGRYQAQFVVPKDISYSDAQGKISVYARGTDGHAAGETHQIIVGGSSATPPNDTHGPEITLYLNDTTFVSGGMTTASPELIVKLFDESGINTVGAGVGHEMLLIVNEDQQRAVNIGNYYQSDENSYQSGEVRFPFETYLRQQNRERLDPGPHTLQVRAWDVLNNSSTASLDFYVSHSEDLALRNVLNYPNPLSRDTRFIFEHNKPSGTPARVQIRIYTLSGRPVRTLDFDETLPAGILTSGQLDIHWDGRDEDFDPVGTGIYLYKVRVEVDDGGDKQVVERIEKLAVIR